MSDDAVLVMWVVYEHPLDYPKNFVVRRVFCEDPPRHDLRCLLADSLEHARCFIPGGLYRLERFPDDDPCIVETWF